MSNNREVGKLKVNYWQLILGIMYIFTAIYGYRHPAVNIQVIATIFILSMMVRSFSVLVLSNGIKKISGRSVYPLLTIGILELILSIWLIANKNVSMALVNVLFSLWFLADALGLFFSSWADWGYPIGGKIWRTVIGIFEIFLGIHMLIHPIVATYVIAYLISTDFLIAGIIFTINSFSREAIWHF